MSYDLLCAINCYNGYNAVSEFDRVFFGGYTDDVWCGVKYYPDCVVVTFRGSTTVQDWFRDFESFPVIDPDLGGVERGFMTGLRTTYAFLAKEARDNPVALPIYITGHSLGAARALLFAALMTVYKIPCSVITFGSPRPGMNGVKRILQDIPVTCYKNCNDPVTDVPLSIFPFLYEDVKEFVLLNNPALPNDEWGMLANHHMELYLTALKQRSN